MKRLRCGLCLGLFLLLTFASTARAGLPIEAAAPHDAFFVVHAAGVPRAGELIEGTGLGKIAAEPSVKALAKPLLERLDELRREAPGIADGEARFQATWAALAATSPCTLSIRPATRTPDHPLNVDVLFVVHDCPEGSKARTLIDAYFDATRRELPAGFVPPTEQFRGTTITDVPIENITFSYCYWKNNFYAGTSSEVVRMMLSGDRKPIGDRPLFRTVNERLGQKDAIVGAYLDVDRARPLVEDDEARRALESPYLASVKALGLGVQAAGGDIRTRLVAVVPETTPLGRELPLRRLDKTLARHIPAGSRLVTVGAVDPAALWTLIRNVVKTTAPEREREEFDEMTAEIEKNLGLSVDGLTDKLGDQWAMALPEAVSGPVSLLTENALALYTVKDREGLDEAIKTVMSHAAATARREGGGTGPVSLTIERTEHDGQTLHYLRTRGLPMPSTPAWTYRDDVMIFSNSITLLKEYLDILGEGPTLADDAAAQAVFNRLPGDASIVGYGDAKAGFERFYGLLAGAAVAGINAAEQAGLDFDITQLPPGAALSRHLGGSGWAVTRRGDLVMVDIVSPLGVPLFDPGSLDIVTPMLSAGPMTMVAGTGVMAAMLFPVLNQARVSAKTASGLNNIRQLGLASTMYANDNRGLYPDTLEVLLEKGYVDDRQVLADPLTGNPDAYAIVKGLKSSAPVDFILVYSKATHDGKRTVFYVGGNTQLVDEQTFQRQMAEQRRKMNR
jgi:hypothetical protein